MQLSRRDVFKVGLFASTAVAVPLERVASAKSSRDQRMPDSALPALFSLPFAVPPVSVGVENPAYPGADYHEIRMERTQQSVLGPGKPKTWMYTYGGTFPGPTIRATKGRPGVVRFINNLPANDPTYAYVPWTSVHLHGSASKPQYDGYADDITPPGSYKDYHYPNLQSSRTLWYHDHGLGHTAQNVYQGLAGQYHLIDPAEETNPAFAGVPAGAYDLPMVVSDAMFRTDGQLMFNLDNKNGFYGNVVLVNGVPWPNLKVERRKYRFRILNASISRSYSWKLSNGGDMTVIATDGGFMPQPTTVKQMRHSMAERYEIVIDFSNYQPGEKIILQNVSPRNNDVFPNTDKVMQFEVLPGTPDTTPLPASFPVHPAMSVQESESVASRYFRLERLLDKWVVNGTTWENVTASGGSFVLANPKYGDVEIWEVENKSGGWFHPFHIHLVDYKILSRNGKPAEPFEQGPKDVAYIGEGEKVKLLIKFIGVKGTGIGKYMVHCHNLVHEDHDMMGQFEVLAPVGEVAPSPLSDPCKKIGE